MTSTRTSRRAATAVALALALGTTGTAAAKPIDTDSGAANPPAPYASTPTQDAPPHTSTGSSDWAYLAIGAGVVGLAAVGGTLAAGQRRNRRDGRSRTKVAA